MNMYLFARRDVAARTDPSKIKMGGPKDWSVVTSYQSAFALANPAPGRATEVVAAVLHDKMLKISFGFTLQVLLERDAIQIDATEPAAAEIAEALHRLGIPVVIYVNPATTAKPTLNVEDSAVIDLLKIKDLITALREAVSELVSAAAEIDGLKKFQRLITDKNLAADAFRSLNQDVETAKVNLETYLSTHSDAQIAITDLEGDISEVLLPEVFTVNVEAMIADFSKILTRSSIVLIHVNEALLKAKEAVSSTVTLYRVLESPEAPIDIHGARKIFARPQDLAALEATFEKIKARLRAKQIVDELAAKALEKSEKELAAAAASELLLATEAITREAETAQKTKTAELESLQAALTAAKTALDEARRGEETARKDKAQLDDQLNTIVNAESSLNQELGELEAALGEELGLDEASEDEDSALASDRAFEEEESLFKHEEAPSRPYSGKRERIDLSAPTLPAPVPTTASVTDETPSRYAAPLPLPDVEAGDEAAAEATPPMGIRLRTPSTAALRAPDTERPSAPSQRKRLNDL